LNRSDAWDDVLGHPLQEEIWLVHHNETTVDANEAVASGEESDGGSDDERLTWPSAMLGILIFMKAK
jgi:hypothetical protein